MPTYMEYLRAGGDPRMSAYAQAQAGQSPTGGPRTEPPPDPYLNPPSQGGSWEDLPLNMRRDITDHPYGPEALLYNYLQNLEKETGADEETFQSGLKSLNQGRTTERALAQNFGKTEEENARRTYSSRVADSRQGLVDRGLYNTTIRDASDRTHGEDLDRSVRDIGERRSQLLGGIESRYAPAIASFRASRPNPHTRRGDLYAQSYLAKSAPSPQSTPTWARVLGGVTGLAGAIAPFFPASRGARGVMV